jgi:hypothetical protein
MKREDLILVVITLAALVGLTELVLGIARYAIR